MLEYVIYQDPSRKCLLLPVFTVEIFTGTKITLGTGEHFVKAGDQYNGLHFMIPIADHDAVLVTGGLQLTSRSEGRRTVSCHSCKCVFGPTNFPHCRRGSNPGPLAQ